MCQLDPLQRASHPLRLLDVDVQLARKPARWYAYWPSHRTTRACRRFEGDRRGRGAGRGAGSVEGLVAKRNSSLYWPGQRSADWVKLKTPEWRVAYAERRVKR